jgi:hypothetical protein
MPLFGKELLKKIQSRCRIKPGMLVNSNAATEVNVIALVIGLSPSCKFDRDYEDADEHLFYQCEPIDGGQSFVDYVCNMEQIS